jgi:hypothetical protein
MSKVWEEFWTFAFLAFAYVFTIILAFRVLGRSDVPDGGKFAALWVLLLWIVILPILVISLGGGAELWRIFTAPFAR